MDVGRPMINKNRGSPPTPLLSFCIKMNICIYGMCHVTACSMLA